MFAASLLCCVGSIAVWSLVAARLDSWRVSPALTLAVLGVVVGLLVRPQIAEVLNYHVTEQIVELVLATLLFSDAIAVKGKMLGDSPALSARLLFIALPLSLLLAAAVAWAILPPRFARPGVARGVCGDAQRHLTCPEHSGRQTDSCSSALRSQRRERLQRRYRRTGVRSGARRRHRGIGQVRTIDRERGVRGGRHRCRGRRRSRRRVRVGRPLIPGAGIQRRHRDPYRDARGAVGDVLIGRSV